MSQLQGRSERRDEETEREVAQELHEWSYIPGPDLSSVGRASDCNRKLTHLNVACSNQAGRIHFSLTFLYRNLY